MNRIGYWNKEIGNGITTRQWSSREGHVFLFFFRATCALIGIKYDSGCSSPKLDYPLLGIRKTQFPKEGSIRFLQARFFVGCFRFQELETSLCFFACLLPLGSGGN